MQHTNQNETNFDEQFMPRSRFQLSILFRRIHQQTMISSSLMLLELVFVFLLRNVPPEKKLLTQNLKKEKNNFEIEYIE